MLKKKAVLFQVQRIEDSKTETDAVRSAFASKSGNWDLIDIADAEAKLLEELHSGIDMLIAHLSDWNAFWDWLKQQPNETRTFEMPADCVMFTTQEHQPCKKKKVSPFDAPVHYISRDKLKLYIGDILDNGSAAIDELDGTERTIRDLVKAVSPYCILRPNDSLTLLINSGLIDERWKTRLSEIRERLGSTLNDLKRWYSLSPRELILEFRGYL